MHEPRNLIVDGTGTIWLVAGVDATRSALYRRDGDTWTRVTIPSMTSFTDVAAVPGTDTLWGLSYGDGRPAVVTNTP
jgi:sugar lactone lactonase YvrE